jgi:hypothetical protein
MGSSMDEPRHGHPGHVSSEDFEDGTELCREAGPGWVRSEKPRGEGEEGDY